MNETSGRGGSDFADAGLLWSDPVTITPKTSIGKVHVMQMMLYGMLKSGHEDVMTNPASVYTVPLGCSSRRASGSPEMAA